MPFFVWPQLFSRVVVVAYEVLSFLFDCAYYIFTLNMWKQHKTYFSYIPLCISDSCSKRIAACWVFECSRETCEAIQSTVNSSRPIRQVKGHQGGGGNCDAQ